MWLACLLLAQIYSTTVSIPLLPKQHIRVQTRRNEGTIHLQGAVDVSDTFQFRKNDGDVVVEFGKVLGNVMSKYHVRIKRIKFHEDEAVISMSMPFVRNMNVELIRER